VPVGPVTDPVADAIPAVTSIVLHAHTIDFLAADGTKVDSAAMNGPADQAAKIITYVLKTSPTVELTDAAECARPYKVSTWPGGLAITERRDGSAWWEGRATYRVVLTGSGYGDVAYESAGGYTVGEPIDSDTGVPGTQGNTEANSLESPYEWFAAEIGNPEAPVTGHWGVMVAARDNVITMVWSPAYVVGDDC